MDILLEAQEPAISKAKEVIHLSIDALVRKLVGAGLAALHQDVFAGVVERMHCDRETFPFRTKSHEELFEHGVRPDPGRATVGKVVTMQR